MALFGIDYDGTWTADPELFREFVVLLLARGHRAVIVTSRDDRPMITDPSRHWGDEVRKAVCGLIPIVFAGLDRRKDEAARAAGHAVDVWIDDRPQDIRDPG